MSRAPFPSPDDLSAWLDGELSEAEMRLLELELTRRPDLREELESVRSAREFVAHAGKVRAPAGFADRVLQRVAQEPGPRPAWWRRPWGVPLEGWGLALVAAAVLFVLLPGKGGPGADDSVPAELSPGRLEGSASDLAQDPGANLVVPPSRGNMPPKPIPSDTETVEAERGADTTGPSDRSKPRSLEGAKQAPAPEVALEEQVSPIEVQTGYRKQALDEVEPALALSIRSDDPTMQAQVLAVAARYGGAQADEISMGNTAVQEVTERWTVRVAQTELARFTAELRSLGFATEVRTGDELVSGTEVDVVLELERISQPPVIPALEADGYDLAPPQQQRKSK